MKDTRMKKHYAIDSDRIYLTGHSMGAIGTWHLAPKYPDVWAALAPLLSAGGPCLCLPVVVNACE